MNVNDLYLNYELKEDGYIYVKKDGVLVARIQFAYIDEEVERDLLGQSPEMMWEKPYNNEWGIVDDLDDFKKDLIRTYGW